ncbi:hypothetical protein HY990_06610 [Candidatus Micrarchaeota archaeon]|nr:hypothetical protein [Candidatus Micrarchaeota archaeon]
MESIDFATIISIANVLMSILLLYVYIKNYLKMKLSFTLGLIIFALLFFVHNLVAVYFQFAMIMYYTKDVASFALTLNFLEMIGLMSLVYITYKN